MSAGFYKPLTRFVYGQHDFVEPGLLRTLTGTENGTAEGTEHETETSVEHR